MTGRRSRSSSCLCVAVGARAARRSPRSSRPSRAQLCRASRRPRSDASLGTLGGRERDALVRDRRRRRSVARWVARARPRASGRDVGLRLRGADEPHAVHVALVRRAHDASGSCRAPLRPRSSIERRPWGSSRAHRRSRRPTHDPVTRGVYEPFLARWGDRFARLRWLQQGMLHAYLLYILVAAIGVLAWIVGRAHGSADDRVRSSSSRSSLTAASGVSGGVRRARSNAGERIATVLIVVGAVAGPRRRVSMWRVTARAGALVDAVGRSGRRARGPRRRARGDVPRADLRDRAARRRSTASSTGRSATTRTNGRKLRLFYGLLDGEHGGRCVVAHNAIALLDRLGGHGARGLLRRHDRGQRSRRARGGLRLPRRHAHRHALLFAMFAVLHAATGTLDVRSTDDAHRRGRRDRDLRPRRSLGFALKAGRMPAHVWLPGAHANSPSHVSALMSGVLIKMGIYGARRASRSFFAHPPVCWGVGAARRRRRLGRARRRVRARPARSQAPARVPQRREHRHHPHRARRRDDRAARSGAPALVALGLAGALLHVWNHGALQGAAVLRAPARSCTRRTRARSTRSAASPRRCRGPRWRSSSARSRSAGCRRSTASSASSSSTSGSSARRSLDDGVGVGRGRVRRPGARAHRRARARVLREGVQRRVPRRAALRARRARARIRVARCWRRWLVLGVACAFIGLAPLAVAPVLEHATAVWAPETSTHVARASLAPLRMLTVTGVALVARRSRRARGSVARARRAHEPASGRTWDCGYAAPVDAHAVHVALVRADARRLLRLGAASTRHGVQLAHALPRAARFHSDVPDTVLDRAILPAIARRRARARLVPLGAARQRAALPPLRARHADRHGALLPR